MIVRNNNQIVTTRIRKDIKVNQTSLNLLDAQEQYFLACRANNISEKTMRGYKFYLRKFIDSVGDIPVSELSPNHIRIFVLSEKDRKNEHTGKQLSTYSINKAYSVVRTFCNWLVNDGYIQSAPTEKIKSPKVENNLPQALTKDEILKIFDYIDRYCKFRDRVIFEFFLDTGCRVNEVAVLNLDDVNIDDGWVKVFGKGRKERIVYMGAKLCHDLNRYLTYHRRAPEEEKGLFVSSVYPFHRLTRDGISTMVKRVLNSVGTTGKTGPHKLRHTMATEYIRNGGEVAHLRAILGHSNISVTQRYVNLVQTDVHDAHRRFSPLDHLDD